MAAQNDSLPAGRLRMTAVEDFRAGAKGIAALLGWFAEAV